jgi:uncharacterized glyoxalase superfamily protein PhnB
LTEADWQKGQVKARRHVMAQAPEPQVWPTLRARDARALITFLVDAFGFEATVVYGDGDQVDHAQLSWPEGGGVMLGSVRKNDEDAHGRDQGSTPTRPGSFGAYVVTDHVDGRRRDHRRAVRHRLRVARLRRRGPGGEPLVVRHLPGGAAQRGVTLVIQTRG